MSFTEFSLFGRINPHELHSLYTRYSRFRTNLYVFPEKTLEQQSTLCAFFLLPFVLFCIYCDPVTFYLEYSSFIFRYA